MKITIAWSDNGGGAADITVDGKAFVVREAPFGWEVGPVEDEPDDAPETLAGSFVQAIGDAVFEAMQAQARLCARRGTVVRGNDPLSAEEAECLPDGENSGDYGEGYDDE